MPYTPKQPFKKSPRNDSSRPVRTGAFPQKGAESRFPVKKKKVQVPKPPRTAKMSYGGPEATDSWNSVAGWYEKHLSGDDTYHKQVLLPNLSRLVDARRGESIVEIACGTGFFSGAFAKEGALVTGIDVSEELIAIARKNAPSVSFHVGNAEKFDIIESGSKDKVVMVLAIQNIEHAAAVFAEVARVLHRGGGFHIVMNHPAFRIPKRSEWGHDEKKGVQYRRVDEYLSESKSAIEMHPGKANSPQTISYHRPLQYYFKALQKAGFAVERLEEWTSHRVSDSGPRAKAENTARKEFPLFLYLGAKRI